MSTTPTIDERITDLLTDVSDRIGADRVVDLFEGILDGAAKTRGNIEKSFDALLGYTNIPTRAEHMALVESVQALGKRIEVLAGRIERLQNAGKKTEKEVGKLTARRAAADARSAKTAGAKAKAAKAKSKPARGGTTSKSKPAARGRR